MSELNSISLFHTILYKTYLPEYLDNKDFMHKVHPVTWGHRYTLVSWVATQKNLYDTIPLPRIPKG